MPQEVKWALGSITMNKASGGDGITVEIFQILKDDAVKVLHSVCQQIWKTQQQPQDWKRSVFIPIAKKSNTKECSNYYTTALISHAGKVMRKILQYESRTSRCSSWIQKKQRNQRSNCQYLLDHRKSKRISEKHLLLHDYTKALECVTTNWKILQVMGIPDHLTCLLYAGQQTAVRTRHGTTDWFKIGKGVQQGCILSTCLFNLYAE